MTKHRRTKQYIERDQAQKEQERSLKFGDSYNYDRIISTQHFIDALMLCLKGVRWKGSVQIYAQNAIVNIHNAREDLRKEKLPELASIKRIVLYERGKKRIICPIVINDRVIQRVLCDKSLVPVLRNMLIYDNGASLRGKGVEFTRKRLKKHLIRAVRRYGSNFYVLSFDFKSFFDSIPHKTCRKILESVFKDHRIVNLTMGIIESYQRSVIKTIPNSAERAKQMALLCRDELRGITLGSQISQIMALVVPSELDHFIKDKSGVKHYIRYMDDGVLFSNDKKYLQELLVQMKKICDKLGLKFNPKKTRITKITKGFVFMKVRYRVTSTGKIVTTLTRPGIVRMRRKLKKFRRLVDLGQITMDDVYNSMQSWYEHSFVAQSYRTRKNMVKLYNKLFDGYRLTKKYQHTKGGNKNGLLQADKWHEFRWDCVAA